MYIYFLPFKVTESELKLWDGGGLLKIFLAVAVSKDFHGPRNSSVTAAHYGKWQWVFKTTDTLLQSR